MAKAKIGKLAVGIYDDAHAKASFVVGQKPMLYVRGAGGDCRTCSCELRLQKHVRRSAPSKSRRGATRTGGSDIISVPDWQHCAVQNHESGRARPGLSG